MKITGHIEFSVIEQNAAEVIAEMPVQGGILNPFGVAHAGAMLWFADVSATILAAGRVDFAPGQPGFPLAINLNANLLGNQKEGVFRARSVFVKKGRSVTVIRTTITGAEGRLIAEVTTTHVPAK